MDGGCGSGLLKMRKDRFVSVSDVADCNLRVEATMDWRSAACFALSLKLYIGVLCLVLGFLPTLELLSFKPCCSFCFLSPAVIDCLLTSPPFVASPPFGLLFWLLLLGCFFVFWVFWVRSLALVLLALVMAREVLVKCWLLAGSPSIVACYSVLLFWLPLNRIF